MECITPGHCRISHLFSLPPHFTLDHSTTDTVSDVIPSHTTFHVTPTVLSHHIAHFISYQHLSQHTIPLCNTISVSNRTISATLCITLYRLTLHPIFTFLTYHITPHSMYSIFQITRYIGHIIYASHPHHILHDIAPHFTSDRDHTHRQFHIPVPCFA